MSSRNWCSFAVVTKLRKRGAFTIRAVNNGTSNWQRTAIPRVHTLSFTPQWDGPRGNAFHLTTDHTSGQGHVYWKLWDEDEHYHCTSDGLE